MPNGIYSPLDIAKKSSGPKATILGLDATQGYDEKSGYLKCERLIQSADRDFRQDYIFGHISRHRDSACFKKAGLIASITLILFEDSLNKPFIIPCLTCSPLKFVQVEAISLQGIKKAWDNLYKDLHQFSVYSLIRGDQNCGKRKNRFVDPTYPDLCMLKTIAEKFNLTVLQYNQDDTYFDDRTFGRAFYSTINNISLDDYVYQVKMNSINFIIVTAPPAPASAVITFISPFDAGIWACLLTSVALITGFLTFLEWRDARKASCLINIAIIATDKLITVTSIFLGQVGQSSAKPYQAGKVALLFVILWLFGYFIVMLNVYQGSIYSCLAVLKPPQPPTGVEDLLHWDIPIIVLDPIYNVKTQTYGSVLLNYILPKLIQGANKNKKFKKFLTQYQERITPCEITVESGMIRVNMKENRPIAALFFNPDVDYLVKKLHIFNNRYIVRNKGDSPFRMVQYRVAARSLLSPYFAMECHRLDEAGISKLWNDNLQNSAWLWDRKLLIEKNKHFEAVQRAFGSVKEPVTFHEEHPVSVDLILPTFYLCCVVLLIAVVAFIIENRTFFWRGLCHLGGICRSWFSRIKPL